MSDKVYPINIWINEERYEKLHKAGLASMAREVLAGLKVIQVPAIPQHRDILLARFPTAKCDTATTGTIEMLPRAVKDRLFALVVEKGRVDVVGDYLEQPPTSA